MVALKCKSKISREDEPVIMLDNQCVPYPSLLLALHLLHAALVEGDLEHLPGATLGV